MSVLSGDRLAQFEAGLHERLVRARQEIGGVARAVEQRAKAHGRLALVEIIVRVELDDVAADRKLDGPAVDIEHDPANDIIRERTRIIIPVVHYIFAIIARPKERDELAIVREAVLSGIISEAHHELENVIARRADFIGRIADARALALHRNRDT